MKILNIGVSFYTSSVTRAARFSTERAENKQQNCSSRPFQFLRNLSYYKSYNHQICYEVICISNSIGGLFKNSMPGLLPKKIDIGIGKIIENIEVALENPLQTFSVAMAMRKIVAACQNISCHLVFSLVV